MAICWRIFLTDVRIYHRDGIGVDMLLLGRVFRPKYRFGPVKGDVSSQTITSPTKSHFLASKNRSMVVTPVNRISRDNPGSTVGRGPLSSWLRRRSYKVFRSLQLPIKILEGAAKSRPSSRQTRAASRNRCSIMKWQGPEGEKQSDKG